MQSKPVRAAWMVAGLIGAIPFPALALAQRSGEPPLPAVTSVLVIEPSLKSTRSAVFVDPIEYALATGTFSPPADGDVVPAPEATTADIGIAGEPKPAQARTWHRVDAKREPPAADASPSDPSDPGTRPLKPAVPGHFEDPALAGGYAFVSVESPVRRVVMLEASGHRHVYVSSHGPEGAGPMTWEPRVGDIYENGLVRVPIVLEAGQTHLLFRAGRGGLTVGFSVPPSEGVFIEERDATLPAVLRDDPELKTYLAGLQVTNPVGSTQANLSIRAMLEGASAPGLAQVVNLPPLSVTKVPIEFPTRMFADPAPDKLSLKVELLRNGSPVHERTFTLNVRSKHDKHSRTFTSEIDGSVQYFAVVPPIPSPPSYLSGAPWPGLQMTASTKKLALILSLHGASVEATSQAGAYKPKDWAWIVCPTNRRPFGFDWEDWGRLDAIEVLAEARRLFDPDPRRLYLTGHSMGGHGTWQLGVTYPGVFAAIAPSAGWPDFWAYTGAGEWTGTDSTQAALRRASAPSRTLELVDRLNGTSPTPIYILHGDKDDNVPVEMARLMRDKLAGHPDLEYHEQPGAGHWWGDPCVDWPPLMDFLKRHTLAAEPTIPDVPISGGGFKDAFGHGAVLVYGTHGTPEENAWALAKARFDSETFLYRGNASLVVVSDEEFLADAAHTSRGAVFYGNERVNTAWDALVAPGSAWDLPAGPSTGVVAVVPRRDGTLRAGLVGGVDLAGMRTTNQLPYFVSGVGYPEWFAITTEGLRTGIRGVSAGWFSEPAR
jgi:pimeloyl-ACP methyl ester carboxylesterase